MYYKPLKANTLCKECLGCNNLENKNFEGVYKCDYYTKVNPDMSTKNKISSDKYKAI